MKDSSFETPEYADPSWKAVPGFITFQIIVIPLVILFLVFFGFYSWGKNDGNKSYSIGYADGYQKRIDYEHGK